MIATIRKGYKVTVDTKDYLVVGSRSFRGRYLYILRGSNGEKVSLSRDTLLQGQNDGCVKVSG